MGSQSQRDHPRKQSTISHYLKVFKGKEEVHSKYFSVSVTKCLLPNQLNGDAQSTQCFLALDVRSLALAPIKTQKPLLNPEPLSSLMMKD